MTIWDEVHYMQQEEDHCLHDKMKRYPELIRALHGSYNDLYCYCLTRSLPPLMERGKMTADERALRVDRAIRWAESLRVFMPHVTVHGREP